MSDNQRLRVYYTYIDNLGEVQAAIATVATTGYEHISPNEALGRIETGIWQSVPDQDDILIMLVEKI